MTTKHSERLTNLAANISGELEELIQKLPPHLSEISLAARMLANRLDREFDLVSISCPVLD
jgi:hypothetical protein